MNIEDRKDPHGQLEVKCGQLNPEAPWHSRSTDKSGSLSQSGIITVILEREEVSRFFRPKNWTRSFFLT